VIQEQRVLQVLKAKSGQLVLKVKQEQLELKVKLAEQVAVGLVARSLSRGRMAQLIQGAAAVAVEPMRLLAARVVLA
jgi:hypothetical protein